MLELLNYNKYEKLLYVEKYNYNHKFQAINLRLKGMIRMNTLLKNQMIKHQIRNKLLIYYPCHQFNEDVKKGKELEILTPNKVLTKLPVLLA